MKGIGTQHLVRGGHAQINDLGCEVMVMGDWGMIFSGDRMGTTLGDEVCVGKYGRAG
jgi:hypothetical protein